DVRRLRGLRGESRVHPLRRPLIRPGSQRGDQDLSPMGQTSSTLLPRGGISWRLGAEVRGAEDCRSLTLETTAFNHTVHTALFGRTGFPPPAAGAGIFARSGGPGAGRTTNARIASVVKRVVRHVVGPDIVPDLLFAPVGEWINFDQTTVLFVR